ncbi:MAG: acyltransferase [Ilumatobacteraceae bacterium]|nr:acyltransferase [Ilumatobacteraceae bacterium]
MTNEVEKQRFRNEIQGLRASASLLIAVYHIWFNRVSGGVDVFFVVSGFLIIGSLTREATSNGAVELGAYFTRMARRIVPLAYVIIALTVVGVWIFVSRIYWEDMFRGIRAAVGYFANFHFAATSVDYLDQDASASPVRHFWAMSIQGQFYFVIPFFVVVMVFLARVFQRSLRNFIAVSLVLVSAVSFMYSMIATTRDPTPMYFNSFARIWEFGLGGLVAICMAKVVFNRQVAAVMSWVGIAVVFLNAIFIPDISYPGYIALVPVMGAVLVLLGGQTSHLSFPIRVLGSAPLVRLGEYSYGFFLWHWPLLTFGKLHFNAEEASVLGGFAVILGALLLSMVTYRLVESPFLNRRRNRQSGPIKSEVFGVVAIVVAILSTTMLLQANASRGASDIADDSSSNGKPPVESVLTASKSVLFDPMRPLTPDPLDARDDRVRPSKDGCFKKVQSSSRVEVCSYGDPTGPTIALVGGSHSLHWSPAVIAAAEKHQWNLQVIVKVTCRYGLIVDSPCGNWVANTEKYLLKNKPDLVVLTSTVASKRDERVPAEYVERWKILSDMDIPILAIRDNPWFPYAMPVCLDENRTDPLQCAYPRSELLKPVSPGVSASAGINGMSLVDFNDYLCDDQLCFGVIDNVVTYRDRDHLTNTYVARLRGPMEEALLKRLPTNAP